MDAVQRLEELLAKKDEELKKAEKEIEKLEGEVKSAWGLVREHEHGPLYIRTLGDPQTLPVPRLELLYVPGEQRGWQDYRVEYRLIYRHYQGHYLAAMLSYTRISGGHDPEKPPIYGDSGEVDLPLRDGAHVKCDSWSLNLPAFAICGDVVQKIEPLPNPPAMWSWTD